MVALFNNEESNNSTYPGWHNWMDLPTCPVLIVTILVPTSQAKSNQTKKTGWSSEVHENNKKKSTYNVKVRGVRRPRVPPDPRRAASLHVDDGGTQAVDVCLGVVPPTQNQLRAHVHLQWTETRLSKHERSCTGRKPHDTLFSKVKWLRFFFRQEVRNVNTGRVNVIAGNSRLLSCTTVSALVVAFAPVLSLVTAGTFQKKNRSHKQAQNACVKGGHAAGDGRDLGGGGQGISF